MSGAVSPRVSVVLGVRDAAHTLPATLDSVRRQRGVDLEIVVVDDGSRDDTARLVAAAAREDARIRVLRQAPSGLTRALRHGCSEARGDLIARIDAGDRMLPGRLATQAAVFSGAPDLAVLGSLTALRGPYGEALDETPVTRAGVLCDLSAGFRGVRPGGFGGIAHVSACFRAAAYRAVGGYRPEFALAQDVDLWARMAAHGRVARLEEVLTVITVAVDGLSVRHHRTQLALRAIAAQATRLRREGGDERPALARAAAVSGAALAAAPRGAAGAYFIASCLARRGDLAPAARYFREALRRDPVHLRSLLGLARTVARRAFPRVPAALPARSHGTRW